MRVAVVGAGIAGASAARFLASDGHRVTLFEQHKLGHSLGSSHGASRIVRRAYPDAFYTGITGAAYPMWRELEAELGEPLLTECGLVYFGREDAANVLSMAAALRELNVPMQMVGPGAVHQMFPALRLEAGEVAVFTPEAGWVDAARALRGTIELAGRAGAELRPETEVDLEALQRGFDAFVVCAGAWVRRFVSVPVTVTLQTYAYVAGAHRGPVWIEDGPHLGYGFPSEGAEFKVGLHAHGPEIDPAIPGRQPQAAALNEIRDLARRRFDIVHPEIRSATGCLYTSTANEDFLFGRVGGKGYFASACSGHGFKFGPWVGRRLADFVEERDQPESYARFFWSGGDQG